MNKKETELVLTHLEYIRKRIDDINGRVRDNEKNISWIKGIGTSVTFIISCVIGYFIKE